MRKAKLIFIPVPGIGHLVPILEFAKQLFDRCDQFSVTVLVIPQSFVPDSDAHTQTLAASTDPRVQFINLSAVTENPPSLDLFSKSPEKFFTAFIESHKSHVRDAIINHVLPDSTSNSVPLVGLVLDFFCTSMIDIGKELCIPSYLFFTMTAAFFSFMLNLPNRHDQVGREFEESDPDSIIPGYKKPVPTSVLPSFLFNKHGGYLSLLNHARRLKEVDGVIINTFGELESHALKSLMEYFISTPPIYPVGPLIGKGQKILQTDKAQNDEIMKWLDHQPPQSVVFLCFGSLGSFDVPQLKEIASGLERSEFRFLWSVRKTPAKGKFEVPSEYNSLEEIFTDGFLERIKKKGFVCGRCPQADVLAHEAVAGFVSHCGWNSILESLWNGVPIATWPIYSEQQLNAFQMVKDLELAVELKLEYKMGNGELVMAAEIDRAVRCVMDGECEVRKRVKEIAKKSREAVMDGGSSFASFGELIKVMLGM